ncbi:MAG: hypothetical protein Tsb009_25140 [Planctomycetaceae bacterium]
MGTGLFSVDGSSLADPSSSLQAAAKKKPAAKRRRPRGRKKAGRRKGRKTSPLQRAVQQRQQLIRKMIQAARKRQQNARKSPAKTNPVRKPVKTPRKKRPDTKKKEQASDVRVSVLSWKNTQKQIARQKGKVVVVQLWASWEARCREILPDLVRLQQRFPRQVVSVSFNVNYDGMKSNSPANSRAKILQFLKSQNAKILNVISSDIDEDVYKMAGVEQIPSILIYDQQGKLVKRFMGPADSYEKDVTPLVKKLLGKN